MLYDVSLLIVLLFLSAFFSSSETALFSISKIKIQSLYEEGGFLNVLIKKMKDDSNKLLITILIGNNLVNIGAAALATSIVFEIFHHNAVSIATGIMTFLILVFGEIFPKIFASKNNILTAKIVIIPIYWCSVLFLPLIFILKFISKYVKAIDSVPAITEKEIMTIIDIGEKEGEIKKEEKKIIYNVLEFDDTSASSIMIPRTDMYVIDINKPISLKEIIQTGYSRFPVIDGNIDNVIGIMYIKDIFKDMLISKNIKDVNFRKIMRPPFFMPESKKLDTLLNHFRKSENHIVIIVDEYGGVAGLVTLEDLLEELIGEIIDETDKVQPYIVKVSNNEWVIPGMTEINDVNKKVDLNIEETAEYDTFSGYILHKTGKIPSLNETIKIDNNVTVTIKNKKRNRLSLFVLKKSKIKNC